MRVLATGLVALAIVACAGDGSSSTAGRFAQPSSTPSSSPTPSTTSIPDPSPTTSATIVVEPSALIGTWLWERGLSRPGLGGTGEFLLEFRPDGTWQARYVGIAGPFDFGTYQFDGSWLGLLSDPAVNGSPCASLSATYAVEFLDIDTLTMPPWDAVDECVERMNDLTKGNFLRVDEGSG